MAEVIAPSPNPPPLTRVVWPTALVVGVIVLMILLNLLMTVEMTMFAHSPNFRLPQLTIVIWPSIVTMIMWLLVEVRSTRYLEPSSERPVRWVFHHMRRLPLLIIAFIAITYGLRYLTGYRLNFVIWLVGAMYESLKVTLLYCCWLALMFGVVSFARMRQQTEHLLNAQKTLVEAKLTQLKAQLRPHFLFNTLNTISALMQVDVARADRLVTLLGDLLRANLNASERNVVPLEEELQLLRQYAEIMQERFVGRVTVEWDIDSNALRA